MYDLVTDNSHGYSQIHRNGPDYDCSSAISKALHDAGFNVPLGCNTSSIYRHLIAIGYKSISKTTTPKRNDIWLRRRNSSLARKKGSGHVAMMYTPTKVMEFSSSRGNRQSGDQTGTEAWIHTWYPARRNDFEFLLRYKETNRKTIYYPRYKGKSTHIDPVFKTIGAPNGSCSIRKSTAQNNGISDYKGTAEQNLYLISLAKKGKLKKN